MQRCAAQLAVLYFDVKYRPGRCNMAMDALSWRKGLDEVEPKGEDTGMMAVLPFVTFSEQGQF